MALGTIAASVGQALAQQAINQAIGGAFGGGTTGAGDGIVREFGFGFPSTVEQAVYQAHMERTCNRAHIDPGDLAGCEATARQIAQIEAANYASKGACNDPWLNANQVCTPGVGWGPSPQVVQSGVFPGGTIGGGVQGPIAFASSGGNMPITQVQPAIAPLLIGQGIRMGGAAALRFMGRPVVQGLLLGIGGDALLNYFDQGNPVKLPFGRPMSLGKPAPPKYCHPCSKPTVYVRGRGGCRVC